jgi:hypothetical protein
LVACTIVRWLHNINADEIAELVFDSAKQFTLDDSYLESENDDSVLCVV